MEAILATIGEYWLEFLCSIFAAFLTKTYFSIQKKIEAANKDQIAIRNGIVGLLKERINQNYIHYMAIGYCPVEALEAISLLQQQLDELTEYKDEIYLNLINELKKLKHTPPDCSYQEYRQVP